MKKVIPLLELEFIKCKIYQIKITVVKTAANMYHKQLRKVINKKDEREKMR